MYWTSGSGGAWQEMKQNEASGPWIFDSGRLSLAQWLQRQKLASALQQMCLGPRNRSRKYRSRGRTAQLRAQLLIRLKVVNWMEAHVCISVGGSAVNVLKLECAQEASWGSECSWLFFAPSMPARDDFLSGFA